MFKQLKEAADRDLSTEDEDYKRDFHKKAQALGTAICNELSVSQSEALRSDQVWEMIVEKLDTHLTSPEVEKAYRDFELWYEKEFV